ncbi:cbb3-type cytochrome oxidase assembly protein CcoS [Saccharophagus sp. K07]|uniref:cbb3-type cytochrome oxidase assembly protein CcoS n=1 Tax=Saccharophagus sp. K07 TaxID=2283636 RepID=UPI00165208FF|nr:cbb3-type cytochrome oxidase assembly protein CcoS [Saccharophagus sp. K07]
MDSLYLLIPLAVILVAAAVWLLFWAVKSGQYDDLDTEGRRILFDDEDRPPPPKKDEGEKRDDTPGDSK